MTDFFRFPHTSHLAWRGSGEPCDDKVLTTAEAQVDGANLGFSTNGNRELRAQNRGGYLEPDRCHDQFRPLWSWLGTRREGLIEALWPDLMLLGEWCVAVHSVPYDAWTGSSGSMSMTVGPRLSGTPIAATFYSQRSYSTQFRPWGRVLSLFPASKRSSVNPALGVS